MDSIYVKRKQYVLNERWNDIQQKDISEDSRFITEPMKYFN